jgi:hypothetical protein
MNKRACGWTLLLGTSGLCACLAVSVVLLFSSPLLNLLPFSTPLKIGDPAPDFSLPGLAGGKVELQKYAGRPVLISLGATW